MFNRVLVKATLGAHMVKTLTLSRFANKEAIHMNARMMIMDFCIKVPRAPVRRKTIVKL